MIEKAMEEALTIVRDNLPLYTYACQNHSSVQGRYPFTGNTQWTCGFWPGEIWLAWEHTHDEAYKKSGTIMVDSFLDRIERKIEVDHHDMGFLYSPSCVAAWQLTGNEKARKAALLAADQLLTRFHEKGGYLQAWGPMDERKSCRYIIDCLLNLPLLYWASRETGDTKYREIALIHTATCLKYSFRPDGSTYHTFYMDPVTGEGVRGETCQGYRNDSSWARGQAWAIYGLALCYRETKDHTILPLFQRVTDYFLSRLPKDGIPYWDLIFTSGNEPRDTSSASIAACALLEMAGLDTADKETYTKQAEKLVKDIITFAAVHPGNGQNGLVLHGTYSKKSPYNTCTEEGVDECVSWGDYFYLEALTRLQDPDWRSYW
jgi:unsaturated chondroitin disaccharide hydrolase